MYSRAGQVTNLEVNKKEKEKTYKTTDLVSLEQLYTVVTIFSQKRELNYCKNYTMKTT